MRLFFTLALGVPLLAGCAPELKIVSGGPIGNRIHIYFKGKLPTDQVEQAWGMAVGKASAQLSCSSPSATRDTVFPVLTGKTAEGEPEYQTLLGGEWNCYHNQLPGIPVAASQ